MNWIQSAAYRSAVWLARRSGVSRTEARQYSAARPSLDTQFVGRTTSADNEIRTSLTQLRGRGRILSRDSSYAKRARGLVVNNVIGRGMGIQGQIKSTRNKLMPGPNQDLEKAWEQWARADSAHTGGELHFHDLERFLFGQIFDAGEIFVRIHLARLGRSPVPMALELIESERVPHETMPPTPHGDPARIRMGIEQNLFGRPTHYWIRQRHPGDLANAAELSSEVVERVPAAEIIHLRIIDRWPQTRGVPWLHTAISKLNDMEGYSEAELTAARGAANYVASVEDADIMGGVNEEQADGTLIQYLEPGTVYHPKRGEKFNFHSPNRPNSALDPFLRYMLREVAVSVPVSYAGISGDYSGTNYSSSRLALLDERDTWRMLQQWYIRSFRQRIHETFVNQAILAGAVPAISVQAFAADREKFNAAKFNARGWGWIDPTKEVQAYRDAIEQGLTTQTQVIADTGGGRDIEDIFNERREEIDFAESLGLEFGKPEPRAAPAPSSTESVEDAEPDENAEPDDDDDDAKRMRVIK